MSLRLISRVKATNITVALAKRAANYEGATPHFTNAVWAN
jgi:hypothetical protein